MAVERADTMPDGWQLWLDWQRVICPENATELQAVEADRGRYLGYVRVVGRRLGEAKLDDLIVSVPMEYAKQPLLREAD